MRSLLLMTLFVGISAFSWTASAQDMDSKEGLKLVVPANWEAGKTSKGAAVVLKSTRDVKSQIEFRHASNMDAKKAKRYFNSFHTNLENAGLKQVRRDEKTTYASKTGVETEYKTESKKNKFRLVVWQVSHKEHAWLVVGWFSERQRDVHYEDFKKVLNTLTFE